MKLIVSSTKFVPMTDYNANISLSDSNVSSRKNLDIHGDDSVFLKILDKLTHAKHSKKKRCHSMDISGQKSPSKEVSPKMNKSRNDKFHRLFKSVPESEYIYNTYSCAYVGDILLHGHLYISQNWFCFYSKILSHETLIEIQVAKVTHITKERTARIIPNAIGIRTKEDKYVFGSLMSRDSTYKLMRHIWDHAHAANYPEKETDEDVSESNNNDQIECDDSHSGNDLNTTISNSKSGHKMAESSCESSESENAVLCAQCRSNSRLDVPEGASRQVSREMMQRSISHGHSQGSKQGRRPRSLFSRIKSSAGVKLQTIPKTNIILVVCTLLAIFLLLSAVILTYKVVALQARLDMVSQDAGQRADFRDVLNHDAYHLNSQYHAATIERFQDVIRANIQVLGQVHNSLKHLHENAAFTQCDAECSQAKGGTKSP